MLSSGAELRGERASHPDASAFGTRECADGRRAAPPWREEAPRRELCPLKQLSSASRCIASEPTALPDRDTANTAAAAARRRPKAPAEGCPAQGRPPKGTPPKVARPPSAARRRLPAHRPPPAEGCPLPAEGCRPTVRRPPKAARRPPSAEGRPPPAVRRPPSAARRRLSAARRRPPAAGRPPQAAGRPPPAAGRPPPAARRCRQPLRCGSWCRLPVPPTDPDRRCGCGPPMRMRSADAASQYRRLTRRSSRGSWS
jgi:hypothetical protein